MENIVLRGEGGDSLLELFECDWSFDSLDGVLAFDNKVDLDVNC